MYAFLFVVRFCTGSAFTLLASAFTECTLPDTVATLLCERVPHIQRLVLRRFGVQDSDALAPLGQLTALRELEVISLTAKRTIFQTIAKYATSHA